MRSLTQEMLRNPQMGDAVPVFSRDDAQPRVVRDAADRPDVQARVEGNRRTATRKALFESPAPDLPDEILHLIFSHAALDPRGHARRARRARRVPLLAPSRVQPALWRDIALRRWGFCADPGGDESEGYDQDADRACACAWRARQGARVHARGRWHRAVAAAGRSASRSATRTTRAATCTAEPRRARAARTSERTARRRRPRYLTRDPPVSLAAAAARLVTRTSSRRSGGARALPAG